MAGGTGGRIYVCQRKSASSRGQYRRHFCAPIDRPDAGAPDERSLTEVLKDMGKIKHHCWAGAILGASLFFVLAVTGVLVSVPTQIDDQSRFRYEVVILGVEVFRYPDDGELYRMRPYPQAITARQHLIAASTIVGAIVGCGVAFALHRFLLRRAGTEGPEVARDP